MPVMPIYKLPEVLPILPAAAANQIPADAVKVWISAVVGDWLAAVVSKIDPAVAVILIALLAKVMVLAAFDPVIKALVPKLTLRPAVKLMIP